MDKKGVAELKRRFTKENCTFTRLCGCYVDAGKNKVVDLSETFLNLEDEEFYKYLEIAKKTLSGTIGNNLLELNFPLDEKATGFSTIPRKTSGPDIRAIRNGRENTDQRLRVVFRTLFRYCKATGEGKNPGERRYRSEERRVGKECRSRWSPYH